MTQVAAVPRPDRRVPSAVPALGYPAFRRVWAGAVVSNTGSLVHITTLGWLVNAATGSAFKVAIVAFSGLIPLLVLSPIAGAFADRYPRRRLLLGTLAAQMAVSVGLATAVSLGVRDYPVLVVFALLGGVTGSLSAPVFQSLIPTLVAPEALRNAVVLNSMQFNVSRALGPAVAGLLIDLSDEALAFWVNAASFLAVIAAVAWAPISEPVRRRPDRSVTGDVAAAMRYVAATPGLRIVLGVAGLVAAAVHPLPQALGPVIATDAFDASPARFGLLVGAFGLGSITAAVVLLVLDRGMPFRLLATFGLAGVAAGVALVGMAPGFAVGVFGMGLVGFAFFTTTTTLNSSLQTQVDDRVRGRVVSLWMMVFGGMAPLGILVQGVIAELGGVRLMLVLDAGVVASLLAVLTARRRLALLDGVAPAPGPDAVPAAGGSGLDAGEPPAPAGPPAPVPAT